MIELLHIDCMEYLKGLPDKAFDLAIVDPPYGIFNNEKTTGFQQEYKTQYGANSWDKKPEKKYFKELFRVSKNQIIWGFQYMSEFLPSSSAMIIWDKKTGQNYFADGEAAFCSIPGTLRIFQHQWCGAFKDSERGQKAFHPTQKPVALYKWLLAKYAKPGDKILDTHLGSGSIAIACHDLGFDLTACELDPDYFTQAMARIKAHQARKDSGLLTPEDTKDFEIARLLD